MIEHNTQIYKDIINIKENNKKLHFLAKFKNMNYNYLIFNNISSKTIKKYLVISNTNSIINNILLENKNVDTITLDMPYLAGSLKCFVIEILKSCINAVPGVIAVVFHGSFPAAFLKIDLEISF